MSRLRLKWGDLAVGVPLPWDVYDSAGQLLMRAGVVIQNPDQIDTLVMRGIYLREGESVPARPAVPRETDIAAIPGTLDRAFRALQALEPEPAVQGLQQVADCLQRLAGADLDRALAWVYMLDADYALMHPLHAALLCEVIARRQGASADETSQLVLAALTHDIGLHDIRGEIESQRGPLTPEQQELVRAHPGGGASLLERAGIATQDWLKAVLGHHERADGSGYPDGVSGSAWPLVARMLAVADIYSAMVRPRAHREAHLPRAALRELFLDQGRTVDAEVSGALIKELGIYPPGLLVRLASGEIGLVTGRGATAVEPVVYGLFSRTGMRLANIEMREVDQSRHAIAAMLRPEDNRELYRRASEIWFRNRW